LLPKEAALASFASELLCYSYKAEGSNGSLPVKVIADLLGHLDDIFRERSDV